MFQFLSGEQGSTTKYTPEAAVAAGDAVLQGALFGIATHAIEADKLGTLAHEGIWKCPKTGSAGIEFAVGDHVYYDADPGQLVTSDADGGANPPIGLATEAATDAATTVNVRLQPQGA
jgi:predicted RecA/RadA family phage recombinase